MGRRARGTAVAAAGLAAVVLVAVVSTRDQHGPVPTSTAGTPSARTGHAEEIARDQQVANASMPASPWGALERVGVRDRDGHPGGLAGPEPPGRRPGSGRGSGEPPGAGVLRGSWIATVVVTVSAADGAELDRQTFPTECSAQGAGAATSSTVPAGDSQYSVDIAPADGAVAAVAHRVT